MKNSRTWVILSLLLVSGVTRAQNAPPTLTYIAGSSVKLEQVIGDCDWQAQAQQIVKGQTVTCVPTTSQTVTRFNIMGNGQGGSFEANGKMIFFFGDTISKDPSTVNYHGADPIAWSTSTDPEAGLLLNFYTNSDGSPLFVKPPGLLMGPDDIPNAGIYLNGQIYFVCNTGSDTTLANPQAGDFSALAQFDESTQTFTAGRTISPVGGHFIGTSLHASGTNVYIFGAGPYRASDVYLQMVPASSFASGAGTQYFAGIVNGQPTWANSEAGAVPVVQDNPLNGPVWPNDSPTIGNVSVVYSSALNLWFMTYDGGRQTPNTNGDYFTYAPQPWGPWATPQLIFNRKRDNAYGLGGFIHDPAIVPDPPGDGLNGPTIGNLVGGNDPYTTAGGEFAPLMIERFTTVSGNILKIYYNLSTWNPYTIVKMRSEFTITPSSAVSQALPANSGFTRTSTGAGALSVSYGQVTATTLTDPVTLAIFGFSQNNVLVTEASIPASGSTTSARIFVDYDQASGKNSGVALVNASSNPQTLNVTLTSQNGAVSTPCSNQQIAGQGHVALFVNQLGCSGLTSPFLGTITFSSATPFAAVNLRAANNAHGEQIFSALPVADLTVPPPSSGNLVFSQIIDGGGTPTQILLMNTTASTITGTISFANDSGNPISLDFGSGLQPTLNYSIPGNGMQKFSTTGLGSLKVAYALVASTSGPLPSGAAVFASNNSTGGLASQAGVLNAPKTTAARVYIERASSPLLRDTGIAVVNANGALTTATVTFNLVSFDASYNQSTTVQMPANGHLAKFIEQIFSSASPAVPADFQGVLNITSNVPISPVTLRLTANQRGDNLFSTLPVADLNNPPTGMLYLPQVVNGGGFTTQIISISTSSGAGTETISFMNDNGQAINVPF